MTTTFPPDAATDAVPHGLRIAYTLNNEQPVRCTIISEEPLFYLDDPVAEVEDEMDSDLPADLLLDFADMAAVSAVAPEPEDALRMFNEQFSGSSSQIPVADTMATLRQSRMGAALLDFAAEHKVEVKVVDQLDAAMYDRMRGIITLRPLLADVQQTLLLARELRRVWQHRQGALIHPLLFHPDHAIVINRVLAADLMTMMVRISWELRLAAQPQTWDYLEQNGHHDLTRAFSREALTDFRSLNNGRAATAAFEAWFISERCRAHDRRLIQQMLADYQGYVFKAGHEETSKMLTHQLIASLGTMTYGKNYLSAHAATILSDPIFTEIRDRSSANFLWFIKFEQSFRMTERDLQQEGGLPTQVHSSGTAPVAKDPTHAAETAQIIAYPQPFRKSAGVKAGSNDATIVDLHSFRTKARAD